MIFVTDKGRMANNIFQYAQLYAWGREHGRQTVSMRFAYKYPDFKIAHTTYHNTFVYLMVKLLVKLHLLPVITFDGTVRQEELEKQMMSHKHVLATGWSVRYYDFFIKYKSEIIDLFQFVPSVRRKVNTTLQQSPADHLRLGVHIRRGDYKTWLGGRLFYEDEQYIQVIRQFAALHPGKKIDVYLCTNDPQLNIAYYQQQLSTMNIYYPSGSPAEDLCLLSECDYLIGALSSFTLVASMYHNTPLYWMSGKLEPLKASDFHDFDYQSRHFDEYFNQCV